MALPTSPTKTPLTYNASARNSPFSRAPSPLRISSSAVPTSDDMPPLTPSKLNRFSTPVVGSPSWTPRGLTPTREVPSSPTRGADAVKFGGMLGSNNVRSRNDTLNDSNALSKLQASQVRELREAFQTLDRDGDGVVNREDIADMLTQLGLPSGPSDTSPFFPPGAAQTISLPRFLNTLASLLASFSPQTELLSALAAFDDDDSGQIDVAELRDALLHTAPEPGESLMSEREIDRVMNGFTGRRAFGRNVVNIGGMGGGHGCHGGVGMGKRGEVFKYQEFVAAVQGGAGGGKENQRGE